MDFMIRPIESKDARGVNALRRMPGVFENILGIPSERVSRSETFIANMGPEQHQFVAVVVEGDSELVIGTAGLSVYTSQRTRHSGGIGIMVHKDYQGMGVGTALLEALLDVADNWLMLVRVELTVFTDNEKAIRLYEKLGFEKEGCKRLAGIRNGKYADEYLMARIRNVTP
mgnify:CR=1 FL=1